MSKTFFSSAVALLLAILSVAVTVGAHGNEKHVIGIVTAISDSQITVETQSKETQVVKIAADTSFVNGGTTSSVKELKVGDRVVIHAKPVGNALVAHEVRFGKAPSAAAGTGAR